MCLFVLGYPKICWQMITFHISRNFRIARGTTFQSAELHDATQASETLQQKCSQHLGSPQSGTSFESKNMGNLQHLAISIGGIRYHKPMDSGFGPPIFTLEARKN